MKPGGKRPLLGRDLSSLAAAPPSTQDAAILKLLGDEDASVVKAVLQQLLADRAAAKERLERLLREAVAVPGAARELGAALGALRREEVGRELHAHCAAGLPSLGDLEEFCWKMALYHDPDAASRIAASRTQIAAWGRAVRDQIAPGASDLERAETLRLVLAEEAGLRGNAERYYDPANSFLDCVVATRRGIPISLCTLYILTGAEAGIEVTPVGMPGHFLIRVGSHFIDPFHEGLTVGQDALRELLERSGGALSHAAWSVPVPWRLVAQRMAMNLVHLYDEAGDVAARERWEAVAGWIDGVDASDAGDGE
jgi:regulator of sirC expression with transglutaminase-like and TPR domain